MPSRADLLGFLAAKKHGAVSTANDADAVMYQALEDALTVMIPPRPGCRIRVHSIYPMEFEYLPDGDLSFSELIAANMSRVEKWHALDDWSPLEWAGALNGESGELLTEVLKLALAVGAKAGEVANTSKKLHRVTTQIANNDGRTFGQTLSLDEQVFKYAEAVFKEYADTVIYGVLLCMRVNKLAGTQFTIQEMIKQVFNTKSKEYGFPERLL